MTDASSPPAWSNPALARRLWTVFEPVHAVTYFSEDCGRRYTDLGLKGFWMGYFASRSACFGAASPELVTATFWNFRPSMVRRALPDAWALASPEAVLAARLAGSVETLRAVLGPEADGPEIEEAAELAETGVELCGVDGRALFAAHLALPVPPADDPLGRLWHAAGLLREHRGDGHVAASVAAGLDGLAAHVTVAATGAVPRAMLQRARGWTDDEWGVAEDRLRFRGWLDQAGALTEAGRAVRAEVEARTDALAAEPWDQFDPVDAERLHALLLPLARRIAEAGAVPAVTPIGVPPA